ncbi:hypothetical protein [Kribbella sp. NPDC051620]|uniref:hypothetical protein n=1 Tax=Kribbella sp. NPDC051620 TaxID=3364120 RepID=UPI0037A92753
MSTTIPEEEFEDGYVLEFRRRLHGRCLWLEYHRDRGAIDLGIRLKRPGTYEVSQTRVWFQLKGLHDATHDATKFNDKGAYADVEIAHLREWYEAPEVVYLAVWVESVGEFVALDVRDLVESRWGVDVRWDEVGQPGQKSIRVWIPPSCLIDDPFLDGLDRHASMRIDTTTWRGQYLGHRLDPLRNELEVVEPSMFNNVVDAILQAHEFVLDGELEPAQVLAADSDPDGVHLAHTRLLQGRLFGTLRWPFSLSIEYGYGNPEEPREEGQWFTAQGKVAVLVMAKPGDLRTRGDLDETPLDQLLGNSTGQTVVFINDIERHAGPWRTRGLRMAGPPLGLGALSAVVLLTPVLYRAFGGKLQWQRPVNRYS